MPKSVAWKTLMLMSGWTLPTISTAELRVRCASCYIARQLHQLLILLLLLFRMRVRQPVDFLGAGGDSRDLDVQ